MAKRLTQLSGKVRTRRGERLDPDRYEFLELSQAEPNLGTPDSDNALITSLEDGTRGFTTQPTLSGLQFKAGALDSATTSTHILGLQGDPFDGIVDVVGVVSIDSLLDDFVEQDTLQTVTSRGATTTENVTVAALTSDSATVNGDLKFTLGLFDNNDRRLIIYDSADNVLWGS